MDVTLTEFLGVAIVSGCIAIFAIGVSLVVVAFLEPRPIKKPIIYREKVYQSGRARVSSNLANDFGVHIVQRHRDHEAKGQHGDAHGGRKR